MASARRPNAKRNAETRPARKARRGKRLKIGVFSFTGDEGCVIVFQEMLNDHFDKWKDLVEFQYARILQERKTLKGMDVAFVEGAISNKREEKLIRKIRKNAKRVVAIGTCAIDGSPSNYRNFIDKKTMDEILPILNRFEHRKVVSPLHELVKVDAIVPGCPIMEDKFIEVLEGYLKEFKIVK